VGPAEKDLSDRIAAAREIVDEVQYTRGDLRLIALMTSNMRIDGHRADLVILKTARAQAAFQGRRQINRQDILLAIELAIPHRLKRGPFADAQVNMDALAARWISLKPTWTKTAKRLKPTSRAGQPTDGKKKASQ
jgi:Mg-chelatase subunit ChlI